MKDESSGHVPLELAGKPLLRHWWVNHAHSDRAQVDGSYLWLAKKNSNGSRNQSHRNMTRAAPGDIVFSCAAGTIAALGFALERARSSPMPASSADPAPSGPTDDGWLIPIRFVDLAQPLRPKVRIAEISRCCPPGSRRCVPPARRIRAFFLAEIPAPMAEVLRQLLLGQVEDGEVRIGMEMDGKLVQRAIEQYIWQRADIGPWDRRQLSARVGQGIFRERAGAHRDRLPRDRHHGRPLSAGDSHQALERR